MTTLAVTLDTDKAQEFLAAHTADVQAGRWHPGDHSYSGLLGEFLDSATPAVPAEPGASRFMVV